MQRSLLVLRRIAVVVEVMLACSTALDARAMPRAETKTPTLPSYALTCLLFLHMGLSVSSSAEGARARDLKTLFFGSSCLTDPSKSDVRVEAKAAKATRAATKDWMSGVK